jgi:predicted PhzF superfamily epimerase YddE/YHI9
MSHAHWIVDAFTDRPFAGNPAAVVLLPAPREPEWMRAIAREMNLSETAFAIPRASGEYDLRWFTPAVEVPLCGHATLATAHVLWTTERLAPERVARFHTLSGPLLARRDGAWIELDLPTLPAAERAVPPELAAALHAAPARAAKSAEDWVAEFETAAEVRALRPDFARVAALGGQGVIATARADDARFDFVSRYFAPAVGIDEDPATGAAHCTLAPYWAARLGRARLTGFQASRRGGTLRVEHRGERALVAGQAVVVASGTIVA